MVGQFAKQSPEDNNNFGINYDYGSVRSGNCAKNWIKIQIMHYSDTDTSTSRVTMLAKEVNYVHGTRIGPLVV